MSDEGVLTAAVNEILDANPDTCLNIEKEKKYSVFCLARLKGKSDLQTIDRLLKTALKNE